MMQFTIYGVDQSSLALDSCLMSSGQVDDIDRDGSDARTGKFVLIGRRETDFVRQQGEKLLCLSQCGNDGVKNGDIVVPQWVLSVLCVESFSRVLAKSVSLMLVDPIILSKVVLIYKGRKSYRHWDEVSTKCSFEVPGAWSIDWPVGISKKALEKFLPVLLQSRKLVNDTLIVVDVLDNTMMFEVKLLMSSSSKTPKEDRDVKCDEEHSATPIDALEERVKNTSKIAEILQLGTAIAITSDFAIIFEIKIQRYIGERKPPEKLSEQGNFHVKCIGISAISVDLEVGQEEAISISTIEKSETMIVNNQRGLNFIDIDSSVPFFLKSSYHRVITICKKILEYDDEIEKTINDCIHEERNRKKVTKFEDFSTLRDLNSSKENIQGLHGRKNRNTSWCGVRSLLISGHEGAGKSYLLNRIERALQSTGDIKNKSSYRNVLILKLSGKKCGYKTIPPSTSASTSSFPSFNFSSSSPLSASEYHNKNGDYINEKQSQNDERNYKKKKETRFHLQNFIQLLKSENQRHENFFTNYRIEKKLNVILLIDDLDSLLLPFVKNENDDIGSYGNDDGDKASVCTTAAFHLRQLLILLAIPDNNDGDDHDQIAIIGATSLSPVALPRANVGAPEFESVLSISRPSMADRLKILEYRFRCCDLNLEMLFRDEVQKRNNPAENLSLFHCDGEQNAYENRNLIPYANGEKSKNVSIWSERVAEMTAGYLPGDLIRLIRKAEGLFLGQKSLTLYKEKTERCEASGGTDDIGNDGGNMFNWKSMLSVIASVPPKQLQKLDSAVHTTGGGGDAEMLSWDSFCGYMDVKKLLKKLLGLSSHRIEVERVMKSGDKFDADKNEMNNSSVPEGSSILPVQSSSNEVVVCDVNGPSTILQKQSLSLLQTMQMASNKVKGIVLYGPSGCGKSFLAKVIAAEVKMNFVSVRSTDILSKYFGETEASIRNLFKQVRAAAPCVLFFDEFDVLAYKRSGTGLQTRILSTFLNELDGIVSQDSGEEGGILVLAACTDIAVLDEALLRPGRLQHHIKLSLPNRLDIEQILEGRIKKMKCNSDVCIRELGSILHNKKNFDITGADVENICRRALIARIREQVAKDAQRDQICEGGRIKKSEYFTRNSAHEAKSHTAYEDINKIDIHMRNFIEAIKECCPSFLSTDPNESKSSDLSKTECLKSFVWDGIYSAGLN